MPCNGNFAQPDFDSYVECANTEVPDYYNMGPRSPGEPTQLNLNSQMTDFAEMSADDRTALIQKITPIIKESGLEGIEVKMSRECVCPMSAD